MCNIGKKQRSRYCDDLLIAVVCFIPQKKRFSMPRLQALGPGSYDPLPVENCRDFSQAGGTSNFCNPIANAVFDPKKLTPAPNTYTPTSLYKGGKNACATGEAVFKSK